MIRVSIYLIYLIVVCRYLIASSDSIIEVIEKKIKNFFKYLNYVELNSKNI